MTWPESGRRGRVAQAAVGVDIGGTKMAAGLVDRDGTVRDRRRRATPHEGAAAVAAAVAELVGELGEAGVAVGVGFPGFVDPGGTVLSAPNLPSLVGAPLRQHLDATVTSAVTVVNDASAAAWGEHVVGAGVGVRELAMLTVGTGVGGGLVLDGALLRGAHGAAGELGHVIVDEGGPTCGCGNRGCLEAHASGTAIARKAGERVAAGAVARGSPLAGAAELGGDVVTAAAADGDTDALEVLADAGFWLGVGVASIVNATDPSVVVIGGGAARGAGEHLLAPARRACAERVLGAPAREPPPLSPGELGDDGGLIGAALLTWPATGAG